MRRDTQREAPADPEPDEVIFLGTTRDDIRKMDREVRRVFGAALDMASRGRLHADAKAMQGFHGATVCEVASYHASNAFRLVYWVGCAGYVFVLHAYQKKSHRGAETPRPDRELVNARLQAARQLCMRLQSERVERRER